MFDDQNQPSDSGQPQNNQPPTSPPPSMEDIKPAGLKPIPPAGEAKAPINLPQTEEPTVMPKMPDLSENAPVEKPVDGVSTPPKSPTPPGMELPDLPKVNNAEDMFRSKHYVPNTLEMNQKYID